MQLENKRVFMVEDNQGNAAIIQLLLEQEGAKVLRGRFGGPDTPRLLKKYMPIDIILMDLMLPDGITGFDVLTTLRQIPEAQKIPVIAVSASDPAIAIPKVKAHGFNGYIAKPVDFEHFAHQVAQVLSGQPVWNTGRNMEV